MHEREIANAALTLADIPALYADWSEISEFAQTFDGDDAWGLLRCREIADARRQDSLTNLRTCLFFEYQRWHHLGEYPDEKALAYVRELVEKIRSRVAAGDLA